MRILIVEDDLASRKIMLKILSKYGECDVTVDGLEAVDAFMLAQKENKPYDLVCLDIMMPKLDGVKVLKVIRSLEDQKNIQHAADGVSRCGLCCRLYPLGFDLSRDPLCDRDAAAASNGERSFSYFRSDPLCHCTL